MSGTDRGVKFQNRHIAIGQILIVLVMGDAGGAAAFSAASSQPGAAAALPPSPRAILMCRHYTAYRVCLRVGCNSNVTASRLTQTFGMLHNIKNCFYFRRIHGWVYMLYMYAFLTFMNCKYCKLPNRTSPSTSESAELPR